MLQIKVLLEDNGGGLFSITYYIVNTQANTLKYITSSLDYDRKFFYALYYYKTMALSIVV